jgi:hypothetical protein
LIYRLKQSPRIWYEETPQIKYLDKLKYFLGIKIAHSLKDLFISQRKYILDLLKKIDKLGCKPAKTPIETNIKLNTKNDEPLKDINHFQRLVGKLFFLRLLGRIYHIP